MNTREFVKELAERLDIQQKEAYQLLKTTAEVLSETLAEGHPVSIQKLGNFSVKKVESRKIFSPKLQKHVMTPPRRSLEFRPAKSLKDNMKNIRMP